MIDSELMAKCAHDIWVHWMRYMFKSGGTTYHTAAGFRPDEVHWKMYPRNLNRWTRQMETEYKDLAESEKVSDREIAEKFIAPVLKKTLCDTTVYIEDEWGEYWTCQECKMEWVLETGTPEENEMQYCPKCGRKIVGTRKHKV